MVTDEPDLERAVREIVDENGVILYHENLEPGLNGYWVEAKDLREGDVFLGANGELSTVVSNDRIEFSEGVTVYNFTVEGNHNYFVVAETDEYGQTSVLVHNAETNYWNARGIRYYMGPLREEIQQIHRERLLREMYAALEAAIKEKNLNSEEADEIRERLRKFVKEAQSTDNSQIIQGCHTWEQQVGKPAPTPGIIDFNGVTWDQIYSLYTMGIFSGDYVGGHAAIEVKIGGKDIFYFDNGWWGHIFTPSRIPFYVRRHL